MPYIDEIKKCKVSILNYFNSKIEMLKIPLIRCFLDPRFKFFIY